MIYESLKLLLLQLDQRDEHDEAKKKEKNLYTIMGLKMIEKLKNNL